MGGRRKVMSMSITLISKKFAIIRILCLLLCLAALMGCEKSNDTATNELPSEVSACVEQYVELMEDEGSTVAQEYVYFENQTSKEMFGEANMAFEKYTIDETEKVNDRLYVLSFSATVVYRLSEDDPEEPEVVQEEGFNYVANIDGEWKFILNAADIPESIQDGFDPEKYKSNDPDIMSPEDAIIV